MPKVNLKRTDYATRAEFRQAIHNQWERKRKASRAITLEASKACGELAQGAKIAAQYTTVELFGGHLPKKPDKLEPEKCILTPYEKATQRLHLSEHELSLPASELKEILGDKARETFSLLPYKQADNLKARRERLETTPKRKRKTSLAILDVPVKDNKRLARGQARISSERITLKEHAENKVNQVSHAASLKRDKNLPDYVDLRTRQAEALEKAEEVKTLKKVGKAFKMSWSKQEQAIRNLAERLEERQALLSTDHEKTLRVNAFNEANRKAEAEEYRKSLK